MRRVRGHHDFEADYLAQLRWLAERGEDAWMQGLLEGTQRIVSVLADFPAMGSKQDTRGSVELRSLRYPTLPYVVWYVYDPTDTGSDLWLVRLFHSHQQRPRPDLSRWLPPRGN